MVPYGMRQPVPVGRVRDVSGEGEGAECVGDGFQCVRAPRGEEQPPAVRGQGTGQRQAEPSGGAGDECGFRHTLDGRNQLPRAHRSQGPAPAGLLDLGRWTDPSGARGA